MTVTTFEVRQFTML